MRSLIFLAGIVMAASCGMTWLEAPLAGPAISPMSLLRDGTIALGPDTAWQTWVFMGGFVGAAIAAVMALMGRGSAPVALLTGATPLVVLGDLALRADGLRRDLGLPFELDLSDLQGTWDLAQDFIRAGLWAYLGGAAVLLLAGLSVFAARR